ncbi:MAG: hypothetical protein ACYCOR_04565 [Acidobacteriaceae bacterium]
MSISRRKVCVAIICLGMSFAGCATREQQPTPKNQSTEPAKTVKPVPPTPIDTKAAELGMKTWDPQWNSLVAQALPPSMLSNRVPRDVRLFCPRFYVLSNADKRTFWAYFFQALAGAEAGLNPGANVRHTEPKLAKEEGVGATKVRTEGLLQLTYADQQRYGCPFDQEADRRLPPDDPARTILQPKNNLVCGVKILENQIIQLHRPLLWHDSYWATLRPGTVSYRVFAKQMINPPAACGLHIAKPNHVAVGPQKEKLTAP